MLNKNTSLEEELVSVVALEFAHLICILDSLINGGGELLPLDIGICTLPQKHQRSFNFRIDRLVFEFVRSLWVGKCNHLLEVFMTLPSLLLNEPPKDELEQVLLESLFLGSHHSVGLNPIYLTASIVTALVILKSL